MVNFKPIETTEDRLSTIPLVAGNYIVCVDTGNTYIDTRLGGIGTVKRRQCFPKYLRQPVTSIYGEQPDLYSIGSEEDPIPDGAVIFVKEAEAYFYFDTTSTNIPDDEFTVIPHYIQPVDPGRWIRFTSGKVIPSIDPVTGTWVIDGTDTGRPSAGRDGIGIKLLQLTMPEHSGSENLKHESSTLSDFSNIVHTLDTSSSSSDRSKVMGYNGVGFMVCPSGGFTSEYSNRTILVTMPEVSSEVYIRYKWISDVEYSDWMTAGYPSSAEAIPPPGAPKPIPDDYIPAWQESIIRKRKTNSLDSTSSVFISFPTGLDNGFSANTEYEYVGKQVIIDGSLRDILMPAMYAHYGENGSELRGTFPVGMPIIVKLTGEEALDVAFDRWQRGQRDGYPVIDFLTKEVIGQDDGLVPYLWNLAHPTADECNYSYYRPFDQTTARLVRKLYEESEFYPGPGQEPYYPYAAAYMNQGALVAVGNIIMDSPEYLGRIDNTGYSWPATDVLSAPRPRSIFSNPIKTSTAGGYYDPNGLLYPIIASPTAGFKTIGDGGVLIGSEMSVNTCTLHYDYNLGGTLYDEVYLIETDHTSGVPDNFVNEQRAAATIPEYDALKNTGFKSKFVSALIMGDYWEKLRFVLPDFTNMVSWTQWVNEVYETKLQTRIGQVLRFTPPEPGLYLEVIEDLPNLDNTHTVMEENSLETGIEWIPTVYCRDIPDDPVLLELISYIDQHGHESYQNIADKVLVQIALLKPYTHHLLYRWWYDENTCTEWYRTPVEVYCVDNNHEEIYPDAP